MWLPLEIKASTVSLFVPVIDMTSDTTTGLRVAVGYCQSFRTLRFCVQTELSNS